MKTSHRIMGAAASVLLALSLFGCGNKEPEPEPTPEEKVWTITFDVDGGSEVESITVKDGETATAPEAPSKKGYEFEGWFEGETLFDWEAVITADHSLKASWAAVKYTITYELNGGTKAADGVYPTEYTVESETFTISDAVPPEGKYWDNWYESAEATEPAVTTIEKGSTGNISLVARYSEVPTFKVTFETNGGSAVAALNLKKDSLVTKPATDPTKAGFKFGGWYADKEFKTVFDFAKVKVTSSITIYAKWIALVTVTFEGVSGDAGKVTIEKGTKIPADKIPAVPPAKPGYKDGKWNFDASKPVDADVTVKATYTLVTYKITYVLPEGVTNAATNPATYTVEDAVTLADPKSEKKPFFEGWFNGEDKVTGIAKGTTGDITLTAKCDGRKLLTSAASKNVKIEDLKSYPNYEKAKLIYVIGNEVAESEKKGYGSGYVCSVDSKDSWKLAEFCEVDDSTYQDTKYDGEFGFKTPESGKTVSYAFKITRLLEVVAEMAADDDHIGANVYNDSSLIGIYIAYDVPDSVQADLTKLSQYSEEDGGIVKEYDEGAYKQYSEAFIIPLSDLGYDGHNGVEVVGQTISEGANILEEWVNGFEARVFKSTDPNVKEGTYNMGWKGHVLSFDPTNGYDTLCIQANAAKADKIIVTEINFTFAETGTCETK